MSRDFVMDRQRSITTITGEGLTAQIRGLSTPKLPGGGIGIGTLIIGALVLIFLLKK